MMNNEGMSSIVVVDNHLNVLGNISTADVKVCEEPHLGLAQVTHNFAAFDPIIFIATSSKHLCSLHLGHSVHKGIDGG